LFPDTLSEVRERLRHGLRLCPGRRRGRLGAPHKYTGSPRLGHVLQPPVRPRRPYRPAPTRAAHARPRTPLTPLSHAALGIPRMPRGTPAMCPLRDEGGAPAGSTLIVPRGVVRGQTDTLPPFPGETVCEHVVPPFSLAFLVLSRSSGIPQTFLMTSCADLVYSVSRSRDGSERTGPWRSGMVTSCVGVA